MLSWRARPPLCMLVVLRAQSSQSKEAREGGG